MCLTLFKGAGSTAARHPPAGAPQVPTTVTFLGCEGCVPSRGAAAPSRSVPRDTHLFDKALELFFLACADWWSPEISHRGKNKRKEGNVSFPLYAGCVCAKDNNMGTMQL